MSQESIPEMAVAAVSRDMELAGGMRLSRWRKLVGISRTTAWRLRKTGRLPVIVRYGTAYITAETIKNFFAGEGSESRAHLTPRRAVPATNQPE